MTIVAASLPVEIGQLKKLESLLVNNNRLVAIPECISQLSSLRVISLSGNRLAEFPAQLGRLRNIDSIDLSNNQIVRVPSVVSQLSAIELNLNNNQVRDHNHNP